MTVAEPRVARIAAPREDLAASYRELFHIPWEWRVRPEVRGGGLGVHEGECLVTPSTLGFWDNVSQEKAGGAGLTRKRSPGVPELAAHHGAALEKGERRIALMS